METAQLVVTSVIALVGLYAANSLRRQQRLKIAEKRISAYRALWEVMEPARITRLDEEGGQGPITPAEAVGIRKEMIHWYYAGGNGILLTQATKSLYLLACRRLIAKGENDGFQRMRELSILRTQMALDLDPFDVVFLPDYSDSEFLSDAGIDPRRWARGPWYKRVMRRSGV